MLGKFLCPLSKQREMTVLALVIKTRFEYSNKKCFRISAFEVGSEVLLQYFEVVHKKFVTHLFDESNLGVWRNIFSFKLLPLADICWALVNVMVSFFSTRRSSVLCGSNTQSPFGHSYILFIAEASKLINTVASIEFRCHSNLQALHFAIQNFRFRRILYRLYLLFTDTS